MKLNEQEIENVLRHAPSPAPPAGLRETLIAHVRLPAVRLSTQPELRLDSLNGWLRRWWPALLPATISLACGVVLWVQQAEISRLNESLQTLPPRTNATEAVPAVVPDGATNDAAQADDPAVKEQLEIARLKQLASQLTTELNQLHLTQMENESLRAQISAASGLSPEDLDVLAKAKERELSIQCCNNLKQFALSVRIWAMDHNEVNPPDPTSMRNELSTPKVLVCPADTNRLPAKSWSEYTSGNCSYDYLAASATNTATLEPLPVLVRCPIHGNIALCDGSVQQGVATEHPDWFVERDGKLYMEVPTTPKQ